MNAPLVFLGLGCMVCAIALGTDLWASLPLKQRVGLSVVCLIWFFAGYVLRIVHTGS